MSILYLASSKAMSAVSCQAPAQCPVEYAHSNLRPRMAVVLLKNLPCTFFERMWDNPVAEVGHPGKVKQAMFGPSFLGPSSLEVSSVDNRRSCSVTLVAAEEGCCFISISQRPSSQGRLRAEHELEAASSIRSLPPSSISPSPKGFVHKIREEKAQHEEEESMC